MAKLDKIVEEAIGEQNTFSFDGLYKGCYIRLESDDSAELINALNLLFN